MKKKNKFMSVKIDFSIRNKKEVLNILNNKNKRVKLIFNKSFKKSLIKIFNIKTIPLFNFHKLILLEDLGNGYFIYEYKDKNMKIQAALQLTADKRFDYELSLIKSFKIN